MPAAATINTIKPINFEKVNDFLFILLSLGEKNPPVTVDKNSAERGD